MDELSAQNIIDIYHHYCAPNYEPFPIVLTEGEGVWVRDIEGKKYVDCLAGYSALNQGHCHPAIHHAMINQAQKITLTTRIFYNPMVAQFLKKLCGIAHKEMVLLMNSGVEAVETAIKAARRWGYEVKNIPKDKAEIIVCEGNFHGRTSGVISFSSDEIARQNYGPYMPGFKQIPFGDSEALAKAITSNTAAFLVEPIQGEAGVIIPPKGYLKSAYELCKEHNVLLILDEIQTGLGRTGKLFAYQYEPPVDPDLLLLGKALSGGYYPVSAVLGKRDILSRMIPGTHGSTFGGNPLAAAIGVAALEIILEEKLPERAAEMGAYFVAQLKSINSPYIKAVRAQGLMIGITIKKSAKKAKEFCKRLAQAGVLCKDVHDYHIRISPPLVISKNEIDWVVQKLKDVFEEEDDG